jgi:hypothetical protein
VSAKSWQPVGWDPAEVDTGGAVYPTAAQVLLAVPFGPTGADFTGTITLPTVGNVRSGVTFGPSLSLTGTYGTITPVVNGGPVAQALDALRQLIANVAWFQTWVGAGDTATALGSVFLGEVGWPVTSVGVAGGVLTVTLRDVHTLMQGAKVTIEGAACGGQGLGLDGTYTIIAVTTTGFTVATAAPSLATSRPDFCFAFPGTRPLAVIQEAQESLRPTSIGTGGTVIFSGVAEIIIEADVATAQNDAAAAMLEAREAYGSFVEALMEAQGTGDLMCLNACEPVDGPTFTSRPEQDEAGIRFERWRATVKVTWGLEG